MIHTKRRSPGGRLVTGLALACVAAAVSGCAHATPQLTANAAPRPFAPMIMRAEIDSAHATTTQNHPEETAAPAAQDHITFRNTPLPQALRLLFDGSGMNLVVDGDIQGDVTMDFAGVTPEQALDALLKTYGLAIDYEDGYAHIGHTTTRTFTLDYVKGKEDAGVWPEIIQQATALLSPSGKLTASPTTGTLVVQDRTQNLERIDDYLRQVQEIAQRQVLIEARIIEVTLSDAFQMGVDFGLFPRAVGAGSGTSVQGSAPGGNALLQAFVPHVGGFQAGVFRTGEFSTLLEALQTQGQVNMLSSPRVSTLNNQTATINVSDQVPVVSREVVSGEVNAASTRDVYSVSFQDAGIKLEVTPQIGADGTMTILVHPQVTEVSGSITTPDGQRLPILNNRETKSALRVQDGESILLGGFIKKRLHEVVDKVPLLGDIPGVGVLFRRTDQQEERVELLILISPRVMDSERMAQEVSSGLSNISKAIQPFHLGILNKARFSQNPAPSDGGYRDTQTGRALDHPTIVPAKTVPHVSRRGLAALEMQRGDRHMRSGAQALAETAWENAIHLNADMAGVRFRLAMLYASRGQVGESFREYQGLSNATPLDPDGLNHLALAYAAAGADRLAIQVLKDAIYWFPNQVALYANLGGCYLNLGEPELAEMVLGEAERLGGSPEAHINRAEARLLRGDPQGAIALYRETLAKLPADGMELRLKVARRIRDIENMAAPQPPAQPQKADAHAA